MIFFLCKDVTFLVLWKKVRIDGKKQPLVNFPTSWTLLLRLPYSPALVLLFIHSLCLILCDRMDCSTPGFPVLHHLPEFAQIHVHWVSDAIQPSHALVVPFSSCLQPFSASQSLTVSQFFASGGQGIGASTSVLLTNIHDWFPLELTGLITPRNSQESFPTPYFESISSSVLSLPYGPTLTTIHDYWKNHGLTIQTFIGPLSAVWPGQSWLLEKMVSTLFLPRLLRMSLELGTHLYQEKGSPHSLRWAHHFFFFLIGV